MSLPVPAPAQIALALAVVRSKPQDVSIEVYISQLRRQINATSSSCQNSKTGTIEETQYWKDAFHKCRHEKELLLEELYEIQQPELQQQSRKRKTDPLSPVNANIRTKRQHVGPGKSQYNASETNIQSTEESEETINPETKQFLKSFLSLNVALKSNHSTTFELCRAIARLCHCFKTMIFARNQPSMDLKNDSSITISQLSERFSMACPAILQALTKCKRDGETEEFNVACVHVIDMLQKILHCIQDLCFKEATRRKEEETRKSNKSTSNVKIVKKHNQSNQCNWDSSCQALAKLVVRLITSTDVTDQNQCELLEVMLCALLERVGRALANSVFSDPANSISNGVVLSELQSVDGLPNTIITAAAITLEAPYLVYMLQQSLNFLRQHQTRMSESAVQLFTIRSTETAKGQSVAQMMEKVLQNTLMRGLFGDNDNTFEKSLLRERSLEDEDLELITNEARDRDDGPEWFLAQVWEHLGWDVLARATSNTAR